MQETHIQAKQFIAQLQAKLDKYHQVYLKAIAMLPPLPDPKPLYQGRLKKIFHYRKDAEDFIKQHGTHLQLFSEEKVKVNGKPSYRYRVCSIPLLYKSLTKKYFKKQRIPMLHEYFGESNQANFAFDLDITDKDEIANHINIVKDLIKTTLIHLSVHCNNEPIYYIVTNNKVQSKERISYHIVFRTDRFVFKNVRHCNSLYNKMNISYKCVDNKIYSPGSLRMLHNTKMHRNNPLVFNKELSHVKPKWTTNDELLFNNSLIIHVNTTQTEIISFEEHEVAKTGRLKSITIPRTRANTTTKPDKNCPYRPLVDAVLNNKAVYTVKTEDNTVYLNFTNIDDCTVCDTTHERSDGFFIIINVSVTLGLLIKLGCWNTDKTVSFSYHKLDMFSSLDTRKQIKLAIAGLYDKFVPKQWNRYKPHQLPELRERTDLIKEVINVRYLEADMIKKHLKKKKTATIIVKSTMGTGKSSCMSKLLKKSIESDCNNRHLSIAPMVTLNLTQKSKLDSTCGKDVFALYSDMKLNADLQLQQNIIITPDSLPRLKDLYHNCWPAPTILWLDECKSLLSYITTASMRCRAQSVEMLLYYIKESKYVIATDADVDDTLIDTLMQIRKADKTVLIHNVMKTITNKLYVYYNMEIYKLIHKQLRLKKKLWICSDSKTTVDTLYEYLKTKYPRLKIVRFTSEHGDKTKLLKNNCWNDVDVAVSSPTIGVGLDVNGTHFNCTIGLFKGYSYTSRNACQALGRVRSPIDKETHIFFDNIRQQYNPTNYDEILTTYSRNLSKCHDEAKIEMEVAGMLSRSINKDGKMVFNKDDALTRIVVNNKVEINKSRNLFDEILLSYLAAAGNKIYVERIKFDVVPKSHKKIKEKLKEASVEVIEDRVDGLLNAPMVTDEKFTKMTLNRENTDKMRKAVLFRKLGIVNDIENNEEGVDLMMTLCKPNTVNQVSNLMAWISGKNQLEHSEILECMVNQTAWVKNINELLGCVGFNGIFDSKVVEKDNNEVIEVSDELLKAIRVNCGDVGRYSGTKTAMNVIGLLKRLVKHYYGVTMKTTSTRTMIDNVRTSTCQSSIMHNSLLLELATSKLQKYSRSNKCKIVIDYLDKHKEQDKFKWTKLHKLKDSISKYLKDNHSTVINMLGD